MNKEEKLKCGIICFLLFIIITSIIYCSIKNKKKDYKILIQKNY